MASSSPNDEPLSGDIVAKINAACERCEDTAETIWKAYRDIINDPEQLNEAVDYLYTALLDDCVVGVALEINELYSRGDLLAVDCKVRGGSDGEEDGPMLLPAAPNVDIFNARSFQTYKVKVSCPNCSALVGATRFMYHLGRCMSANSRESLRNANTRLGAQTKNKKTSSSTDGPKETVNTEPQYITTQRGRRIKVPAAVAGVVSSINEKSKPRSSKNKKKSLKRSAKRQKSLDATVSVNKKSDGEQPKPTKQRRVKAEVIRETDCNNPESVNDVEVPCCSKKSSKKGK